MNPLLEFRSILSIARAYRRTRPGLVHHVALKPVAYGSIVARALGIPAINTIAGLGYSLAASSLKSRILKTVIFSLMKLGYVKDRALFVFQNSDDRTLFVQDSVIEPRNCQIIAGSGVNTHQFIMPSKNNLEPNLTILLPSRMILQKGIKIFIDAAHSILKTRPHVKFVLAGPLDGENRGAVTEPVLNQWCNHENIRWIGNQKAMVSVLHKTDIVVLPTFYREGIPKSLIEAAACGRPIVTTDVPGCREIVLDGVNGFVVPPQDVDALSHALLKLIDDPNLRKTMGLAGRRLVEDHFSMSIVNAEYIKAYRALIEGTTPNSSIEKRNSNRKVDTFEL
jgi:glycosyltransferase involved in cell wall biosynthesis